MTDSGVWRTVSGRRIFIKDGQDLTSAMKESGKFEGSKSKISESFFDDINFEIDMMDEVNESLSELESLKNQLEEEKENLASKKDEFENADEDEKEWIQEELDEAESNVEHFEREVRQAQENYEKSDQLEVKRMLQDFKEVVDDIELPDGVEIDGFSKTSGGISGSGYSYLVHATVDDNSFVLAKLSDHSKYNHEIQIFTRFSKQEMKSVLSLKNLEKVVEEFRG